MIRRSGIVVAALFALLPLTVRADPPGGKERHIRSGEGAHKVIKLGDISVEGHIQKPQAFYILPRSNLNYSALEQQESFLPKIKKALRSDPF